MQWQFIDVNEIVKIKSLLTQSYNLVQISVWLKLLLFEIQKVNINLIMIQITNSKSQNCNCEKPIFMSDESHLKLHFDVMIFWLLTKRFFYWIQSICECNSKSLNENMKKRIKIIIKNCMMQFNWIKSVKMCLSIEWMNELNVIRLNWWWVDSELNVFNLNFHMLRWCWADAELSFNFIFIIWSSLSFDRLHLTTDKLTMKLPSQWQLIESR